MQPNYSGVNPSYYNAPVRNVAVKNQQASYLGNNNYLLSVNTPAPVSYEMGSGVYGNYDGIKLIANNNNNWKA